MSGWVHCSFNNKAENRKQFLRAYKDNGKTKYEMYSDDAFPTESDVISLKATKQYELDWWIKWASSKFLIDVLF